MFTDYRTVNGVLEYPPCYKYQNPKDIVSCDSKLILGSKKYSLLYSITACYGAVSELLFSQILINNRDTTIQQVIRYESGDNVMNQGVIEEKMDKALSDLVNISLK